jgi:hypothetical protein
LVLDSGIKTGKTNWQLEFILFVRSICETAASLKN